jgi:hypothetical protein
MKGKNFSTNNCNNKRHKSDYYQTPSSLVKQLLEIEHFDKNKMIREPACGDGSIVKELWKHNFNVNYSDKYQYDFIKDNLIDDEIEDDFVFDFLNDNQSCDYIITNPPFSLALEFILHAKTICQNKFAMLLPLSYLHGVERYNTIYQDHRSNFPLKCIYVFTRYPMLSETVREDGKYKTGMMVLMWAVWDKNYEGKEPTIRWINNQQYVLSKKDGIK